MLRNSAINFVLKAGLGVTCLGLAIYSFAYPNVILDFYPQFMPDLIGDLATLIVGALIALFMAIWVFSRRHKFACAFVFFILILTAMIGNITSLRFISVAWPLLIISTALVIRYYPRVRIIVPHKDGERMRIVPIKPDEPNEEENVEDEVVMDESDEKAMPIAPKEQVKVAKLEAVKEVAPEVLANDPAKTEEFLSNEHFERGNKFFENEQPIGDDEGVTSPGASTDAGLVAIDMDPKPVKPKRAYKPRAKKPRLAERASKRAPRVLIETDIDTGFSNSDSLDIHEAI